MKSPFLSGPFLLCCSLVGGSAAACTPDRSASHVEASAVESPAEHAGGEEEARHASFTRDEMRKLDPTLRHKLTATERSLIPVRVSFDQLPPPEELSTLMLVRYQRYGIGRVDRATLKQIVARADVEHVSYLAGTSYATPEQS